jgi:hypothetical protein
MREDNKLPSLVDELRRQPQQSYEAVARWESRSGKWWAELFHDGAHAFYRGVGCGGNMGIIGEPEAIAEMQRKVDSGYFQPDAAKTPMKRVR